MLPNLSAALLDQFAYQWIISMFVGLLGQCAADNGLGRVGSVNWWFGLRKMDPYTTQRSPLLRIIYWLSYMTRHWSRKQNDKYGIKVGGRIIEKRHDGCMIRFADDKAVVANSKNSLQKLTDSINKVRRLRNENKTLKR